jgi:hypothetical protein
MDILSAVQPLCRRYLGTDPSSTVMNILSAMPYSPSVTDLKVQILQKQIWIF